MNRAERRRAKRAGDYAVADTGIVQRVPDRVANADPAADVQPGEHLWVMLVTHRIRHPETAHDPTIDKYLDMETLMSVIGPGCFLCEAPYEPGAEHTTCPGESGTEWADVQD